MFILNIYLNNVLTCLIKIRLMFLKHYNIFYILISTHKIKINLLIKSIQIYVQKKPNLLVMSSRKANHQVKQLKVMH